jgi:hypothetical protein
MNYLTYPHISTKHMHLMDTPLNLNDRRFITLDDGEDSRINFVTVQDFAHVVTGAVDYAGEWPVNGGIRGTEVSIKDLIALSEKIRGGVFDITKVRREDILAGEWKASWAPVIDHPAIPKEQLETMSKHIAGRLLLAFDAGGYVVNDNWNRLVPGRRFTELEEFLTKAWAGKP